MNKYYIITFLFVNLSCLQLLTCQNLDTILEAELNDSASSVKHTSLQLKDHRDFYKAQSQFEKKNYEDAIKLALKLLGEIKPDNFSLLEKTNFLIGDIFKDNNDFKRALKYYEKSYEYGLNINDVVINSKNLFKLGSLHFKHYNNDTLKYKDSRDKSIFYLKKVLEVESDDFFVLKNKAKSYSDLSAIYFLKSKNKLAEEYAKKAIIILKKQKDTTALIPAIMNLANNYLVKNNYSKAKSNYVEILSFIEDKNTLKEIKLKESLYDNIAYTMFLSKDYKAFEYLDKSFKIRDSLREVEIRGVLAEVDAKYNAEQIKNIERQKTLVEKSQRIRSQQLNQVLFLGIVALVIGGLIFYRYLMLRKEKLELEFNQKQLIKQQELDHLEQETQTKVINAAIDGKEEERKELAEVLHDSVSALLSSANLHLQASKSQIQGEIPEEITKTQSIISEASEKIRNLSHEILSSVLLKFGLSYSVQDLCEKYSNSTMQFEYTGQNLKRYDQKFEIKINSIIEELINNIIKHSKASNAQVSLTNSDENLKIFIKDNGVGFDAKVRNTKNTGIGLTQIEARIKAMKGVFTIESSKNQGTEIYIEVPILHKD